MDSRRSRVKTGARKERLLLKIESFSRRRFQDLLEPFRAERLLRHEQQTFNDVFEVLHYW